MTVKQISVGPMANFVYLVADEESREALVVDSGWQSEPTEDAARGQRRCTPVCTTSYASAAPDHDVPGP